MSNVQPQPMTRALTTTWLGIHKDNANGLSSFMLPSSLIFFSFFGNFSCSQILPTAQLIRDLASLSGFSVCWFLCGTAKGEYEENICWWVGRMSLIFAQWRHWVAALIRRASYSDATGCVKWKVDRNRKTDNKRRTKMLFIPGFVQAQSCATDKYVQILSRRMVDCRKK